MEKDLQEGKGDVRIREPFLIVFETVQICGRKALELCWLNVQSFDC
jgi:hypothetical protein